MLAFDPTPDRGRQAPGAGALRQQLRAPLFTCYDSTDRDSVGM